jgi:MFS family permease
MSSRPVVAVVVGVLLLVSMQWGLVELGRLFRACCFTEHLVKPLWVGAVSNVAYTLSSLLPGFVAGWISRRNVILVGFATGVIGSICHVAIFGLIPLESSWVEVAMSGSTMLWFTSSAFGLAISCAAAGAAAQVLRSNNALERERGR